MPITFIGEDFKLETTSHNDAMVIKALIAGWTVGKVLVDIGSSADILFANAFREMNIDMNTLNPADIPLLGFGGKPVKALGKIALPVLFGDRDNARTEHITFDVVEMHHPYNAILGRGFITKMDATIRQLYLCMKIPAHKGIITVYGDQQMARNIERGAPLGQKNVHHLPP
ncbi:uncharacterized protein [Setaria viridis]|uniref:uncharacterized protein n=1 Tax=Setaria viridis TaxID=4556 RepID=UPI003B3BE01B